MRRLQQEARANSSAQRLVGCGFFKVGPSQSGHFLLVSLGNHQKRGAPPPSPLLPPSFPPFFSYRPGMDRQTSDLKRQRLDKEEEIERFKVLRLGLELVPILFRRLWSWKPHVAMATAFLPWLMSPACDTRGYKRRSSGTRSSWSPRFASASTGRSSRFFATLRPDLWTCGRIWRDRRYHSHSLLPGQPPKSRSAGMPRWTNTMLWWPRTKLRCGRSRHPWMRRCGS